MSRMFSFIDKTWNPVRGKCPYDCSYCWAKALIRRNSMEKYEGTPCLDARVMARIPDKGFIFVQDMSDIGALNPREAELLIFELGERRSANYLLLTKNPLWYHEVLDLGISFPDNVVLGATIETNKRVEGLSKAPPPDSRLIVMKALRERVGNRLFVSVEPIMNFDPGFGYALKQIHPWAVAVGYDNYNHGLSEPRLDAVMGLINNLEQAGILVYRKTLR